MWVVVEVGLRRRVRSLVVEVVVEGESRIVSFAVECLLEVGLGRT